MRKIIFIGVFLLSMIASNRANEECIDKHNDCYELTMSASMCGWGNINGVNLRKNCAKTCDFPCEDFCASNPCQNGGTCDNNSDGTDYECVCDGEWRGKSCEIELVQECDPYSVETCQNVGTLLNLPFSSGNYKTKGCYAYNDGSYNGIYFGTGGDPDERKTDPKSPKYRPVGSKKACEAAGKRAKLTFEEGDWPIKGCYAYNNGATWYSEKIYYSNGGSHKENLADPGSGKLRPCPWICVPRSMKACEAAGKILNKTLTEVYDSRGYYTRGCYTYPSSSSYDDIYYGKNAMGGHDWKISTPKYRPFISADASWTPSDCFYYDKNGEIINQ